MPSDSLDAGWALGLSIACERHLAFGSSLLFTYGPLGCLTTWQYWPALYGPAIVLWSAITLLTVALLVEMQGTPGQRITGAVALAWLGMTPDTALLALPVMVVLHAANTRHATAASWLAVAVLAAVALTKFTLFPLCLASVSAAALLRHSGRLRSIAVELGLFGVALLLVWVLLARQQLADFPDWLRGAAEISAAYSQAMANPDGSRPPGSKVHQTLPYDLLLAAMVVLTTADLRFRSATSQTLRLPFVAWGFMATVLVIVVRHATVRADDGHLLIGFSAVGALALLIAAAQLRGRFVLWTVAAACAFVYMLLLWPQRYALHEGTQAKWKAVKGLLHGQAPQQALDRALAVWTSDLPPPPAALQQQAAESFDIIGHDQFLLGALPRERWQPRPVLQSYSAYSPALAQRNAAALSAADGPHWLLVRPQTIDRRWTTQDDAAVWPLLRTHFSLVGRHGPHLLLERKAVPDAAQVTASPLPFSAQKRAGWIDVPAHDGDALYVAIDIPATVADHLRSIAWKPPIRRLAVMRDGADEPESFRLVSAVAAAGFLLEPELRTVDQLQAWLRGTPSGAPRVRALRIQDEHGRPLEARVSFSTKPFPLTKSTFSP